MTTKGRYVPWGDRTYFPAELARDDGEEERA